MNSRVSRWIYALPSYYLFGPRPGTDYEHYDLSRENLLKPVTISIPWELVYSHYCAKDAIVHIPLLANFRAEAHHHLRLRNADYPPRTAEENVMGLEIILNVLQGIVLIGLRECGELQLEKESLQSIRGAMEEAWIVEALVDLLSLAQTVPSTMLPTHELLNTLFIILVNLPSTLPAFTAAGGYETIAGLLKLTKKEVKVKAIEFLVYLGTLATEAVDIDGQESRKNENTQQRIDVFGTSESIDNLPSTPKRKHIQPEARSQHTRDHPAGRTSSGNSTASTATNQADLDLLRTPVMSQYGSDIEVWPHDTDAKAAENFTQHADIPGRGNVEAFQFPKAQSSSALSSYGFYTPQQRSEKHHASRSSTSGSSQGSREDSGTFKPPGTELRRSSLSVRPSTTQQRIPSLRSLARVEEELAITPKKLVDMSPARLKADFRDSEVRKDMCSTIKMRGSSRPSSGLRSPKTPNAGRNQPATSESETASTTTKGLTRDSSRTSLQSSNSSKSTEPRLLIPSGKVNIGLGFPGTRPTPSSANNTLQANKLRTGSAEYPLELAKDSRIRGLAAVRTSGNDKRVPSNDSDASQKSASGMRGMRKSQTLTHLAGNIDDDGSKRTGTMRRSDV